MNKLMKILKNESVVATTSQAATNSGDDESENSQATSADVKPDVDTSVVPGL